MTGEWRTVIGLETHCQLGTRTKLFCGCANAFGAEPNANTCEVCTGQPGSLPLLNARAQELAVRAALALDAHVAPRSAFDRKNYFYCDLPKGFQTTQYDAPFSTGGGLALGDGAFVRLTRIHMEEDAGKAIHDRGDTTLVDLNRAGVPLIEIVTEPDLASAAQAVDYLTRLREILVYAGVSDCDMEKGSLRCDVNVSVHREGDPYGTRVELKNLNSFRAVHAAIEYEVLRQTRALEAGEAIVQETRLFDVDANETRTMRVKEDEDDYRYFPEPDLPPVLVTNELLATQRAAIPELPVARRARYTAELGLSEYDAGVLTAERATSDFFDAALRAANADAAKALANWTTNELLAAASDPEIHGASIDELRVSPAALAALVALVERGELHNTAARRALREMLLTGNEPADVVRELGLAQVSDTDEIDGWCASAIEADPRAADQVRAGNAKAIGALIGAVMKQSKGRANPELVRGALDRLLSNDA